MKFEPREIELKGGDCALLREAEAADAQAMLRFLHEQVATSPYVLTVPEDVTYTLEQETELIVQRRDDPRSLWLLALIGNEIAGASSLFAGQRFKNKHTVDFGTTVAAAWRNKGLGRAMLDTLIQWSRENPQILRITLDVMADNGTARRMYLDAGFREIGVERRAYRQPDGSFADGIPMEMWVG